jgi:tRNA (guanosine-2'-O-)-methyltransferase
VDLDRAEAVIAHFSARLTPERVKRMQTAVSQRMQGLTVVLEALYDPGNRSAVYRTAEAHGLLDVHVVRPENATKSQARQVSRGAEKWLHIHEHARPVDIIPELQAKGMQVVAADLTNAGPLHGVRFDRPTALVFGNERDGISPEMRKLCDGAFMIPMRGLMQSFNISVAAAIALSHARRARERAIGAQTDLSADERTMLLAEYLERSGHWLKRMSAEARAEIPSLYDIPPWPPEGGSSDESDTMTTDKKALLEQIETLRTQLHSVDPDEVDESLRTRFESLRDDLDEIVEDDSFSQRVKEAKREFAASHPKLSQTLDRIAETLSSMGI